MAVRTVSELKEQFKAGSIIKQSDFADLIDSMASWSSNVDQPLILKLDSGFRTYIQNFIDSDGGIVWRDEQYEAAYVEELIKHAMIYNNINSVDYDDVKYVLLYNDDYWGNSSDSSADSRLFAATFADHTGTNKVITVLPVGKMVAFARNDSKSFDDGGDPSYSYEEATTANWRPVGETVGITEYELSQLKQESTYGGNAS